MAIVNLVDNIATPLLKGNSVAVCTPPVRQKFSTNKGCFNSDIVASLRTKMQVRDDVGNLEVNPLDAQRVSPSSNSCTPSARYEAQVTKAHSLLVNTSSEVPNIISTAQLAAQNTAFVTTPTQAGTTVAGKSSTIPLSTTDSLQKLQEKIVVQNGILSLTQLGETSNQPPKKTVTWSSLVSQSLPKVPDFVIPDVEISFNDDGSANVCPPKDFLINAKK